jgi:hypothetical protein
MRRTWRQLIARKLRAMATWLDPAGKPGPKRRKARIEAVAPLLSGFTADPAWLLEYVPKEGGFPQEIEEPRA